MKNLDVSIIILSFNTKDITDRCLTKLEAAKDYCQKKIGNKINIIVLDNASDDGSVEMIKEKHPKVKLIVSKINTGFAKGNNIVMKQTKTPYFFLINSDVYVEEDCLYKALAYFRVNLNCDVLGPRLNYASGQLQPSAGFLPNPLNIIFWILGLSLLPIIGSITAPFHPKGKSFFSKAHQVDWIMGAFFAIKRKVFVSTKGFDETLFMHMEEVEWSKRIRDAGFKIWYVPQIEMVHLHGASTNFDLSKSFLNELKGIKYYLNKHYPLFSLPVKLILIFGLILRVIVFSLIGKTARARVYLEGLGVV
ncbi:MAG: glycosyltransferase family 2 protein [Patescibacteria group bacterium]